MPKKVKYTPRPPIEPLGSIYDNRPHEASDPEKYAAETNKIFRQLSVIWTIGMSMIGFIFGAVIEHNWPQVLAWMFLK